MRDALKGGEHSAIHPLPRPVICVVWRAYEDANDAIERRL